MDTTSAATEVLERELLEDEAAIARHRASQMTVLRELGRRQAPLRDGYRPLKEWSTGRMDIAPETAGILISPRGASKISPMSTMRVRRA